VFTNPIFGVGNLAIKGEQSIIIQYPKATRGLKDLKRYKNNVPQPYFWGRKPCH